MKLHTVDKGQKVKILDLSSVDPLLRKRLYSFGIKEGCELCIKQKGLFSGACVLECEGQNVGIRRKDLMTIEVEKL
ncbi:FeoA family protein [Peribacillus tepidiphilus]|jgi:ferrous iron transport protein A|uniref:FeoA family protein n=1 Tax=Peribacillus tepidiphilus TaxID=2652445 RepID=UPI001780780D|nr:FeoA family protein [Peribacillus tepidiphilus]